MAADNVTLNAGTGGSTLRTFADAAGNEWPSGVACYATTVSAGANVLEPVTPSAGLPVAQQGPWAVSITEGSYTVSVTAGLALKVDGSAVTQPVSGTVTANVGTTGGLALDASVQGLLVAQAASGTGVKGPLVQGLAASAAPSYTAGDVVPLQVDLAGNLLIANGGLSYSGASLETSTVFEGSTALTPLYAVINASTTGSTTVIAATAGKRIRPIRWAINAAAAVNAVFQTSSTSAAVSGTRYLQTGGNAGGAECRVGHWETLSGDGLVLNLSGNVAVSGEMTYVLV